MITSILIDNDVALKICCYNAVEITHVLIAGTSRTVHVLGALKYVLSKTIERAKNIANKGRTLSCFNTLLGRTEIIEPTESELSLAADFEETALDAGVDLDPGESQLLAVLIQRTSSALLTGDKRAIHAIELVGESHGYGITTKCRVACLGQLVMTLVSHHGAEVIQKLVCSEPSIDKTLGICFSCRSGTCLPDSIVDGLRSYIHDLRTKAPNVLLETDDLSSVIT